MKKISFVCVNYSHFDYTVHWVNSILGMKNIKDYLCKIIVVNNSENKQETDKLKLYLGDKTLVKIINTKNRGYFTGLNEGIKYLNSEYGLHNIVVSNNDILFDAFFIKNYYTSYYSDDDIVIVPDIMTIDGIHQNPQYVNKLSRKRIRMYKLYYSNYYIAVLINLLKGFFTKKKTNTEYLKSQTIHLCTGACMILREQFFRTNTKLDDRVFMWGEEALLSHQIEQCGGKTYYDKNLQVLHFEHGTVSSLDKKSSYNLVKQSFKVYQDYL